MQWHEVRRGSDSTLAETLDHHRTTIRGYEYTVDVMTTLALARVHYTAQQAALLERRQALVVARGDRLPGRRDRVEFAELRAAESRGEFRHHHRTAEAHPGVVSHDAAHHIVPVRALFAEDLGEMRELVVVCEQSSAFTGHEVLRLVEAHAAQCAKRAAWAVVDPAAERMRGVLDHGNRRVLHPDRMAGVVGQDDRFRGRRHQCQRVIDVDVEVRLPYLTEDRASSGANDRVAHGGECK